MCTKKMFSIQKKLLNFVGIHLEKTKAHPKVIVMDLIKFLLVTIHILMASNELYYHFDFEVATNNIFHIAGFLIGFLKIFATYAKRNHLLKIFNSLEYGRLSSTNDRYEEKLIKTCVSKGQKQVRYFITPIFGICFVSMTAALIKRALTDPKQWNLPMVDFEEIHSKESPLFEMHCLQQTFAFILAIAFYLFIDVVFISILTHLCVQCKIISHRIEKVVENTIERYSNGKDLFNLDESYNYFRWELKEIIVRQNAVYKLARWIQESFNLIALIGLGGDTIILCLASFHATLYSVSYIQCIRDLVSAVTNLFKTLILCYYGNEVLLASLEISSACYKTNFVGTPIRFQKDLNLMIFRSQFPITIKAGAIAPIALTTFITIVRAAYTYFTVLRTRNE